WSGRADRMPSAYRLHPSIGGPRGGGPGSNPHVTWTSSRRLGAPGPNPHVTCTNRERLTPGRCPGVWENTAPALADPAAMPRGSRTPPQRPPGLTGTAPPPTPAPPTPDPPAARDPRAAAGGARRTGDT